MNMSQLVLNVAAPLGKVDNLLWQPHSDQPVNYKRKSHSTPNPKCPHQRFAFPLKGHPPDYDRAERQWHTHTTQNPLRPRVITVDQDNQDQDEDGEEEHREFEEHKEDVVVS